MHIFTWLAVAAIPFARPSSAAGASDWAARSIYQVVTDRYALPNGSTTATCNLNNYCGGTWNAITQNLDYIQNMGFTALQISPVDKNIPNETDAGMAYHGYWPSDKYSLNENFGTAEDLKNLADELHKRDMFFLVDVVVNDMAYAIPDNGTLQPGAQTDFSALIPFNQPEYYNPLCNITDWNDPENYINCWFSTQYIALPDLNTKNPDVNSMYSTWIKELVQNYSIDGLRIDAAKSLDMSFLPGFIEAAGVWAFSEVDSGTAPEVCVYSNVTGLENYPVYYSLIQAFTNGNMTGLAGMISDVQDQCETAPALQNFAENHDQPRFASLNPDMAVSAPLSDY
jgi:alpha-amylase